MLNIRTHFSTVDAISGVLKYSPKSISQLKVLSVGT
jgi:hypothetical protein